MVMVMVGVRVRLGLALYRVRLFGCGVQNLWEALHQVEVYEAVRVAADTQLETRGSCAARQAHVHQFTCVSIEASRAPDSFMSTGDPVEQVPSGIGPINAECLAHW